MLRVKPTATEFPTDDLHVALDNIPVHIIVAIAASCTVRNSNEVSQIGWQLRTCRRIVIKAIHLWPTLGKDKLKVWIHFT